MKRSFNSINQSLRELNNFKRLLRESYGDSMPQGGDPNAMGGDPNAMGGDPNAMGEEQIDPQMGEIIDKIRQLAIQGIAQFADDIESEQYQALKKIWLLTDKFYEDLQGDDKKK